MTLEQLATKRTALWAATLKAAFGGTLPELDEPGWSQMGEGVDTVAGLDRIAVNREAWRYYHTDPHARHVVRLKTAYTFGRGVSHKASDPEVNQVVQRFWRDPRNRASISTAKAQWRQSRDSQLNGELFLAFFTSTVDGSVTVRLVQPSRISKVVTMPGDPVMPSHFHWKYRLANGKDETVTVPDWRNAAGRFVDNPNFPRNTEVHMMHIMTEPYQGRGISELTTIIPWIKALKGFMEDRATLTMALSMFAFKQKIKGNRQAVARMSQQWGAYEAQQRYGVGGRERAPGGNTIVENEAANLEQLKTDSGASNAYQDMRMFRQMASIGAGLMEHYTGDAGNANLATATAMELPMLKMFEFNQQMWADVYGDIFEFVIRQAILHGGLGSKGTVEKVGSGRNQVYVTVPTVDVDLHVETIFPRIVQRDIAVYTSALSQIAQAESMTGQAIMPPEQKAEQALGLFGYTETGDIIDAMRQNDFKIDLPATGVPGFEGNRMKTTSKQTAVREAEGDEPPKVGKALPKAKAEQVDDIDDDTMDKAYDDWSKLPPLDDLEEELGMTAEEIDNA